MGYPTGEQLEIAGDGYRAVITAVGAGLRAFDRGGVRYLETFDADDEPPLGAGGVLVPWPNRVAGGVWRDRDGTERQLELSEPARGNAIHGLVRHQTWTVTEHGAAQVELAVEVSGAPGWPYPFRSTIRYALDPAGLTVTHGVHNLGDAPMPFGVGTHPYPRPADADIDDCTLSIAASTVQPVDEATLNPNAEPIPLQDNEFALRGVELDTAFGGCAPGPDGLVRHAVRAPDGSGVQVWAEPDFGWVQVFTPPSFPGRTGRAIAVEPMTCPPDALNSGTGLLTVQPGASWHGRWGITPLASRP